ncbi:AHH domain-containing protein [Corallococcus sp. M34]|uniref:AHH domain-containing protein n=1 Tax=Citreicoccus inhibens TaxID=2849499 RepID=UPI001C24742C|nr:AHH domain-containing protein [Citreicoccus inhibens]MBU8899865.1 AHH domain-containing protein [Citreicoccus inhibens]
MSGKQGHFGDAELDELHDPQKNTTENGACLTGHQGNFADFKNKVSCNYRYQAYEQAKGHDGIKARLHRYNNDLPKRRLETSAYPANKGGMTPDRYCAHLEIPEPGDWDVEGPFRTVRRRTFDKRKVKIRAGYNFTQDTWPYWNNAHHLIPKGTLESEFSKQEAMVSNLMQKALLKTRYNVNHKKNMLMIPQDREVAELLQLPRHIQLKDGDTSRVAASCTDHPVYSQMTVEMLSGLQKIISDYREICQEALLGVEGKEHAIPDAELDKTRLESLSTRLLNLILSWGPNGGGRSLDKLASRAL